MKGYKRNIITVENGLITIPEYSNCKDYELQNKIRIKYEIGNRINHIKIRNDIFNR
jgi:hypothetical protein